MQLDKPMLGHFTANFLTANAYSGVATTMGSAAGAGWGGVWAMVKNRITSSLKRMARSKAATVPLLP